MSGIPIPPDPFAAAGHRAMAAHLTAPLAAGAVETRLAITPAARVVVDFAAREPVILAAVRSDVAFGQPHVLFPTLDPDGAATALSPLTFAEHTPAGTHLPLYLPPVTADSRRAQPFSLSLRLEIGGAPADAAGISDLLAIEMMQGVTGRLLVLLGHEGAVLRRQAAELAAMRGLAGARRNALDRHGADLGVPRLTDRLVFDADRGEIGAEAFPGGREDDARYRRRLSIYRPFVTPNRRSLLTRLNGVPPDGNSASDPGTGSETGPNTGPLAELGVAGRFDLLEADNRFTIAARLVEAGAGGHRAVFLSHLLDVHLIRPLADGDAAHAARPMRDDARAAVEEMRALLRSGFDLPPGAAFARGLAAALARAARLTLALGGPRWSLTRALDPAGGSRFGLGLGAEIARPPAPALDGMRAALLDPGRPADADPEIASLLRGLADDPPPDAGADPFGRWLLRAAGCATTHRTGEATLYVSHIFTDGLVISGPDRIDLGPPETFTATYRPDGDVEGHVVLRDALDTGAAAWEDLGEAAWTELDRATAEARWATAEPLPPGSELHTALLEAGLTAIGDTGELAERLAARPPELIATLDLPDTLAAALTAPGTGSDPGPDPGSARLASLLDLLRRRGMVSALPLPRPGGGLGLVVGVSGLPHAGLNLAPDRSAGFNWSTAPVAHPRPTVFFRPRGAESGVRARGPGLFLLVAVGYARRGASDPYEVRVEPGEDVLMDLEAYEFLMNILAHAHPAGVEINTSRIRESHVDLRGDGVADALPPELFRGFRAFRQPRTRRAVAPPTLTRPSGNRPSGDHA